MNWTNLNINIALPEIVLLSSLFVVLLIDLWTSDANRKITHYLSLLALVLTAAAQYAVWSPERTLAFNDFYIADSMSRVSKMVMYATVFALFVYAKPYNQMRGIFKGEFYTLSLFALVGTSIMVSAGHFLTAYLGLELLSLSLYALIALRRDSANAAEAALKYFVLGALASGLLLYGISLIYGATGSLDFASILAQTHSGGASWLLKLGLIFVVVAIAFKLGAVPFHMWVPDVYQGAPTSVAALVGTAPKIAAVLFTFRILVGGLGLEAVVQDWTKMLMILAVASLLVGNLAAIMQTNIKRMLAYSTISHMGFVLLAFGAVDFASAMYYALTYIVTGLVAFGVLMLLSNEGHECEEVNDLAGLNQRNAWYAFLMLLAMFSMAGIPPLMGFYAKFTVINAMLGAGYTGLAVFAVVMSLIGAFYYLRVVKVMYFDTTETVRPMGGDAAGKVLLSVNGILLLVWGILPGSVMAWCIEAVKQVM